MNKLSSFVICSLLFTSEISAQSSGKEWVSRSQGYRTEFVAAYLDCYTAERDPTAFREVSWYLLEPKVTQYYDDHPKSAVQLAESFRRFAPNSRNLTKGGEIWKGKHGFFDGEYWPTSSEEKLGFVSGYIYCHNASADTRRFSHTPEWYVAKIDHFYGEAHTRLDRNRLKISIADVMYRDLNKQRP